MLALWLWGVVSEWRCGGLVCGVEVVREEVLGVVEVNCRLET